MLFWLSGGANRGASSDSLRCPHPAGIHSPLSISEPSTTRGPGFLNGRSKEFQCDVVRVTAGQPGAVSGINYATIGDTEFFEPNLPRLNITSSCTGKRQVVETNSTFIKRAGVRRIGKLVKSDDGLTSDKQDSASKWAGAFVQHQLHSEESFVPLDTAVEITDCQSHVGDRRKLRHGGLLIEPKISGRQPFLPGGALFAGKGCH